MQKLNYLQQKKLSPADELREILNSLEGRLLKISAMNSTQALIFLRDLDRAYLLFDQIEATGTDLQPEQGRFKAVQSRLRRSARPLLKSLGGPAALAEHRPRPSPSAQQWWWSINEIVAAQRAQLRRRLALAGMIILLVLGGIWLLFNTILAPSPEVIARVKAENNAYNAADQGDYQAALAAVETGLAQSPHDSTLLLLQGVLLESLGEESRAAQSFDQAQASLADPLNFYFGRGQLRLRLNQVKKAEADARSAVAIDENSAAAWLLLGQTLEVQDKTSEAVPAYEKASQLAFESGDNQVVVLARMALGRIGLSP